MARTVLWFRRDLRLLDHPALAAAAADAADGGVVPLFVVDDALLRPAGPARAAWVLRSVRALADDLAGHGARLVVRHGRPEQVVPEVAREVGATAVHISSDHAPYGRARDRRVHEALDPACRLTATGSPYAVAPGRLTTKSGSGYLVFSPFYRAWLEHGWRAPADSDPSAVAWADAGGDAVPEDPPGADDVRLPAAGEHAAHAAWSAFRERAVAYDDLRDRPDLDQTSRLSPYLKAGAIHPRTLLAELRPDVDGEEAFRRELAFRDFYAAVLHFHPASAREYMRTELQALPYVGGDALAEHLDTWAAGRTGFPLVDAGMRQLLAQGWMHNRVRMLVASFLVKDLGVEWQHGARHFLRHLADGDLASNQHGWQWAAGTGTDAAPYFRIFNPITQGERFDPDGDYIRRWVPELRDLTAPDVHRPWRLPDGPPNGYPIPIVDHAEQRVAALEAYQQLRDG
jgi:deoxyribodipyrimidine photo-lyase